MDEINGAIVARGIDDARSGASIPEPLKELVGAVRTTAERRRLLDDALAAVAARMPPKSAGACETQAGLIVLAADLRGRQLTGWPSRVPPA